MSSAEQTAAHLSATTSPSSRAARADPRADNPPRAGHSIETDLIRQEVVWAGTDIGVHVSIDSGDSWYDASEGMADVAIFDPDLNPVTGDMVVCTQGRSAYRVDFASFRSFDGFEEGDTSAWSNTSPQYTTGRPLGRVEDPDASARSPAGIEEERRGTSHAFLY